MKCPYCSHSETKVIDSRETEDITRRRRECLNCTKRFTTYERVESVNLVIIKKDLRREPYNRDKLKRGLIKACEKRPVSHDDIEKIVDKIESKLKSLNTTEIKSTIIGEEVMRSLKKLDKVAYIRFASVYKDFKDISDFKEELKWLKEREGEGEDRATGYIGRR